MTCSRADHGLSGSIEFNGKVGVSFCISVDAVIKNIKYRSKKNDKGYLPAEYIEASSDSAAVSASQSRVLYRVSLFIRNLGGVLPLEAWVNSYSTKGNSADEILNECTIGGFGYGLKDAVLCFFTNQFNHFNVYATDPLGLKDDFRGNKSFYRAVVENSRRRLIKAKTLNMKVVFHDRLTPYNENVPKIVREVSSGLPSTVVSISSVVDASELENRIKTLVAAVKCHKIFDLREDLDDFDMPAYLDNELGQGGYADYCSRLKNVSAIRTQASATAVARAKGLQSSVEVYAPCVDDPEATFYTEVTGNTCPSAEVSVFTWPGLQLLRINRSCQGKLGKVVPTGSRFTSFTLRFPNSFKNHTQRDRAYTYTLEIGALLGSSIIAACTAEQSKNPLSFPDFKSASSLQEVEDIMQIASDTFPLNDALCKTVLDVLKAPYNSNGHAVVNINLDFLACYGEKAGNYLLNFFGSFYPVENANDQGIATLLHKERTRCCSEFDEFDFNKIGVPIMVPASLNMLFVQKAKGVESSARNFLIQLAAFSRPWSPPINSHPYFQDQFKKAVLAEKKLRNISLLVYELDIDPAIVKHFEDKVTKLLRYDLTADEEEIRKRLSGSASELVEVEADPAIKPATSILIFSFSQNLTLREKIIRICSQGNSFTEYSLGKILPGDGSQSDDDESVSSVCSGSLLSSSSGEDGYLSAVDYTEVIKAKKPSNCVANSSTALIHEHNLLPSKDSILTDPFPDSETLDQTRFASGILQAKNSVENFDKNDGHSCDDDSDDNYDDVSDGDGDGDCDDNDSDDCYDNDDISDKEIKRDDWVNNIGHKKQHRDALSVEIKSEKAYEASMAPTESSSKQNLMSAARTRLTSSSDLCECVKRSPGAVLKILEQCLAELPLIDQQAL